MLLDDLEAHFQRMADAGINNLAELKSNLSSPKKLSSFSAKTAIPEDYLVILRREFGSLEQKPVLLSAFPGISGETVGSLSEQGIKTSKDFYNLYQAGGAPAVCGKTGIGEDVCGELNCLCNLVRMNGVGAAAARAICEGGYHTIDEIAHATAGELLRRISEANAKGQYYSAKLGVKDMQFVIDSANLILEFGENRR